MEPVTVTIPNESAYESYLETLTNHRLAEISWICRDLADHIPSSMNLVGGSRDEMRPFVESVTRCMANWSHRESPSTCPRITPAMAGWKTLRRGSSKDRAAGRGGRLAAHHLVRTPTETMSPWSKV